MATFESGLVQNRVEAYTPPIGGQVFTRTAEFVPSAVIADDDVIEMIPVFDGERVLDVTVVTDIKLANAGSIDVGDGDDVDRYIDGGAAAAVGMTRMGLAATTEFRSGAQGAAAYKHRYTEDDTIDIHVDVTTPSNAGGTAATRWGRVWMQATLVSSF